ncbi:MAG: ABC transporter ATP-binding protein [Nitrososphaerota archaeon]|nr:ABC transporter ATP-binding protein [Nitrososphaerota archaeon]MDG7024148.1 ABC transporter ATP-binding protein [Nitrososphaerota archaeon]
MTSLQKPEVLRVSNLRVSFNTYAGEVKALDGIELTVRKGEVLGLVGESGCGKSVTALAIAGLLPPNAAVLDGNVVLDGREILGMNKKDLQKLRLEEVAMVFQDPMTFLNPVIPVGSQITEIMSARPELFRERLVEFRVAQLDKSGETVRTKGERARLDIARSGGRLSGKDFNRLAKLYAISVLGSVRLPEPEKVFRMFPHELSGGMRQRAMIAMALVRRPKLILADEITTALDVTVQAQVLQLLRDLKAQIDASVVFITHDLAVIAELCDRVAVMYAGNVVELADVAELFRNPLHPYTVGLLASVPRVDAPSSSEAAIRGSVPDLINPPTGCRFHPRCPKAFDECPRIKPSMVEVAPGHFVSCLLYGGDP